MQTRKNVAQFSVYPNERVTHFRERCDLFNYIFNLFKDIDPLVDFKYLFYKWISSKIKIKLIFIPCLKFWGSVINSLIHLTKSRGWVISSPANWEAPGSNLGPESGYYNWDFCVFPQFLQANVRIVISCRPRPLAFTYFRIH